MCSPQISIIVPVYNAEKTLEKCLDSIIKQSFAAIEVLIIDDGSTDRSGLICDYYAEKDCRVKVWHTENRGSFAARNLALSNIKTPYLGFVDADDWLEPNMYEILYKTLDLSTADFVQCGIQNEGPRKQIKNKISRGQELAFEEGEIYEAIYSELISHSVNDKLFRLELFEDFCFFEEYYHSDAMAMMQLLQFCKKVICIGELLYHYRTDNVSITRGGKNKRHLDSVKALFSIYEKMAYRAPGVSDYYLCKEIPSMGRLITPNHDITCRECLLHIRDMHRLFCRHWKKAKKFVQYDKEPVLKRLYWNIYYHTPYLAIFGMYLRLVLRKIKCEDKNDKKTSTTSIFV